MKKALANQIAKLWNENFTGSYEPTKTKAIVNKNGVNGDFSVEIVPDGINVGNSFHHNDEVTDVSRAFKVSSYMTTSTKDGFPIVIARIF